MNAVSYVMPAVIVVLLDSRYLKEEYFGDKYLAKLVKNLLVRLNESIRKRKRQLTFPYWEENQPRMVFVRPVPRPAFSMADPDKYKNIKRKFSQEIEDITAKHKFALANMDELNASQRVLFDDYGNLSDYGIERFWKS